MSARYEFKVGPVNRHTGYAKPVTVVADNYGEAEAKAIALSGWGRNGKAWLISIEEIPAADQKAQS